MQSQLPNILTWIRILLIPLLVFVFLTFEYSRPLCGIIFAVAAFTDLLDGYLARKWNVTSKFGAFLDPVADKLLVAVALVLLVKFDPSLWMVLCAIIIIGREITVSALREWLAGEGKRDAVKVQMIGKLKTIFQMGAIFALLYQKPLLGLPTYEIGRYSLILAALLTIISMSIYLKSAWDVMKD